MEFLDNGNDMEDNSLESNIIEAARCLFMENGYAETSMCDIAAKVGIKRPVLHYYFRTKDKMFQAVFGTIAQSMVPTVEDILFQKGMSFEERARRLVDAYYNMFLQNPSLPLFIVREINRDAGHLIEAVLSSPVKPYMENLALLLKEGQEEGMLRPIPLNMVFYTFYGLLIFPFLTRNFSGCLAGDDGKPFESIIEEWKPYVVSQIVDLLVLNDKSKN